MRLLCRIGRHQPLRDKARLDLQEMRQNGHCKRCGAAMERDANSPWRLKLAGAANQPADSTALKRAI